MSVTLVDEQTKEERVQQLYDRRLDWAAVEKAFDAKLVELVGSGVPGTIPAGDNQGLTRQRFEPGETVSVTVEKRGTATFAKCLSAATGLS